jgi:hypothetical protein
MEWYCVDTSYGYEMEPKTGNLLSGDEDMEKNLAQHLTLKHIFKDENCIIKVINGESFPISQEVKHLGFCFEAICADLVENNDFIKDDDPSL